MSCSGLVFKLSFCLNLNPKQNVLKGGLPYHMLLPTKALWLSGCFCKTGKAITDQFQLLPLKEDRWVWLCEEPSLSFLPPPLSLSLPVIAKLNWTTTENPSSFLALSKVAYISLLFGDIHTYVHAHTYILLLAWNDRPTRRPVSCFLTRWTTILCFSESFLVSLLGCSQNNLGYGVQWLGFIDQVLNWAPKMV